MVVIDVNSWLSSTAKRFLNEQPGRADDGAPVIETCRETDK